jgi:hypothetical protein
MNSFQLEIQVQRCTQSEAMMSMEAMEKPGWSAPHIWSWAFRLCPYHSSGPRRAIFPSLSYATSKIAGNGQRASARGLKT